MTTHRNSVLMKSKNVIKMIKKLSRNTVKIAQISHRFSLLTNVYDIKVSQKSILLIS